MISQEELYSTGEWITAIGLFTTIIGLLTMIHSYEYSQKIDVLIMDADFV